MVSDSENQASVGFSWEKFLSVKENVPKGDI